MYKVLVVSLWMTFSLNVYATQPPSILIVHSYSQEYPWTKGQNNGFIEALNDRSVQISTEYLDTKRLSLTPQYEDFFSKYLSNKYAEDQPSLIYTTDDNALNFIINQERTLFPKAKVVFSGVNNLSLNDALNDQKYIGIFEKKDPKHNIEIISKSLPSLNQIYFVGDASSTDKAIIKDLNIIMKQYPRYQSEFLSDSKIENILLKLKELPSAVVILTTIGKFYDENAHLINIDEVIRLLTSTHKHIVMVMEDSYLQKNVIGGFVTSSLNQGKQAGEIASQILQGKTIDEIAIPKNSNVFIFDRQELLKQNIVLPREIEAHASIVNETKPFWQTYQTVLEALLILSILGVIIVLIVLLYISRKKNKVIHDRSAMLEKKTEELEILLSLFDKGEANLFKWNNDENWSIEYVSKNVEMLMGYSHNMFISKERAYAECIHPDDISHVLEEVENAIKENANFFKHDPYRIITKSGTVKWVLDYTMTQKNKENQITHFIGYISDITELKNAKQEAENANRSKSEFLANMSHEIRTPMNGVLGFLEQLSKTESDPRRVKKFDIIKNSGEQLLNIINDILDFSKIESGKLDIDVHSCYVHKLIENTMEIYSELASKKNINLSFDIDENLPECILADKTRLQQIGFNLMSNAVKFTPNNGDIKVVVKFKENSIYFAVEDNGIGISKEKINTIFEAFVQEDKSTTRKYGGTGLGLAISYSLIKLMNSELKVESELGKGSRFYFELPVEVCNENIQKNETGEDAHSLETNFKAHALIVEDNKTNQMLMSMILDDLGLTYEQAFDGVEAIELFENNSFDIILMDENMPNMNGIEATKHIRDIEKEKSLKSTPIVAVTANALSGDKEKFLNVGMDDYISKPFAEKDIIKILNKFL